MQKPSGPPGPIMVQCVMDFGCTPKFRTEEEQRDRELIRGQLRLAHCYYNDLVAVERERRNNYNTRCDRQSDDLKNLSFAIEAAYCLWSDVQDQARSERVQAQSRKGVSDETEGSAKTCEETVNGLWKQRRVLIRQEKEHDPRFRADIGAIDRHAKKRAKKLRQEYAAKGLFWGTYLATDQAIEQARESGRRPHFRKGGGVEGQIAVQLQGGLPVANLDKDTRLQILPRPEKYGRPAKFYPRVGGERPSSPTTSAGGNRSAWRAASRMLVKMRVGSDGRAPIWVTLPVVIHRPLPPEGCIKWARIHVRRIATKFEYRLQLTIAAPRAEPKVIRRSSAIGIDLGWRWQKDAVRVAYTCDSKDNHGPVSLAKDVPRAIDYSTHLQSRRDKLFEAAQNDLADWIEANKRTIPKWFKEYTVGLRLWRNPGKLARLILGAPARGDLPALKAWRDNRIPGDEEIFKALEGAPDRHKKGGKQYHIAWRRQDRHLWEWARNNERKALARRREEYRKWAAMIAENYSVVAIEDFDLRNSARKAPVEEKGEYDDLQRSRRIQAAPGELRNCLVNACRRRGTRVTKVPCEATTITCNACGGIMEWRKAKYLCHVCEHCGVAWDQDENAARNILDAALKTIDRDEFGRPWAGEQAPRLGRWARRRIEQEKQERKRERERKREQGRECPAEVKTRRAA